MKMVVAGGNEFLDAIIAYADLDLENMRITNEVEVTSWSDDQIDWYPTWTADEEYLLFMRAAANYEKGRVLAYEIATRELFQASRNNERSYRYPLTLGVVK
jgi:hypothetical protein